METGRAKTLSPYQQTELGSFLGRDSEGDDAVRINSQATGRQWLVRVGLAVLSISSVFAVASRFMGTDASSLLSSMIAVPNSKPLHISGETISINIGVASSASFSATLKRVNYDSLPYFTSSSSSSSFLEYSLLSGYNAVVEPYADMIVDIYDGFDSDYKFLFTVCPSGSHQNCSHGEYSANVANSVSIDCTPHSTFTVSISKINIRSLETSDSTSFDAICLYVRRDMESLTDDDLDEVMDVMHTMWEYTEEEGQELFGSNFHSASYFSDAHFYNAARRESDHIHEGLGFIAQHIKLTNWFESSMQAINPKVTIPYWEFTRESINKTIYESIMFTERTFGSLAVPSHPSQGFTYSSDSISSGSIKDGRWAYLTVNPNLKFEEVETGFGLLRSPWNMNPSPYITRFASSFPTVPSCTDYYSALSSQSILDFIDNVQKGPHASVHAVVGNIFGCDLLNDLVDSGLIESSMKASNLCRTWNYLMKDLYRDNYLSARTNCSLLESDETFNDFECGYECSKTQYHDMPEAIENLLTSYTPSEGLNESQWLTWRDFICEGDGYRIIVGNHMDSSSASDPSFWPIHPTQERLLHAKVLSELSSTLTDSWPTDPSFDYVCDTATCYDDEQGTKDYHDICCVGHFKDDQMLDFIVGDRNSRIGETNSEILEATNAASSSYSMSYIYDSLSYSHCSGSSDVDDLLENNWMRATRAKSQL